jgi:hypothetical protein
MAFLTDSSLNNLTVTAFGNASFSTSVKKFGSGAAYFDGNGDYLQTSIPGWSPGVGGEPFTVEFWVYRLTANANYQVFVAKHGGVDSWTSTNGLNFNIYATSTQLFCDFNSSGAQAPIVNPVSIPTNQWTHLVLVYDGTTTSNFVNGVKQPNTNSNSYFSLPLATTFEIGSQANGNYPFNGYIDELRITKGIARYTSNFTPPTAAFPNP